MSLTLYMTVLAPSGGVILQCSQYKIHKLFCRLDQQDQALECVEFIVFGSKEEKFVYFFRSTHSYLYDVGVGS